MFCLKTIHYSAVFLILGCRACLTSLSGEAERTGAIVEINYGSYNENSENSPGILSGVASLYSKEGDYYPPNFSCHSFNSSHCSHAEDNVFFRNTKKTFFLFLFLKNVN